ncbi:MAG TPA: hypothetical protein PLA03_12820 [Acidobacteriota bacterium]|nr:hypothetical protein [Acidobacteriota bacterium]
MIMKRSHSIPDPLLVTGKPYCKGSFCVITASLMALALFLIWHWLPIEEYYWVPIPLLMRHVWKR